jgi:hypothetical protein
MIESILVHFCSIFNMKGTRITIVFQKIKKNGLFAKKKSIDLRKNKIVFK